MKLYHKVPYKDNNSGLILGVMALIVYEKKSKKYFSNTYFVYIAYLLNTFDGDLFRMVLRCWI